MYLLLFFSFSLSLSGTTYFVATNGNDNNPGTQSSPWLTWQKAFDAAQPGDIVNIRGGIYYVNGTSHGSLSIGVFISGKNGTSSSRITFQAYQNEVPVLDCSGMSAALSRRGMSFSNCSYITLKGLTIRNVKEYGQYNACPIAESVALLNCSNMNLERCVVHDCGNGFSLSGDCDYINYLNCDAYNNIDFTDDGGYANGFSLNMYVSTGVYASGTHVTLTGCRSWGNSDDGFDTYGANGYFTFTDCWAFSNGKYNGNGDGFKSHPMGSIESGVQRTFNRCASFNNTGSGFSSYIVVVENLFNCIAFNNIENGFGYASGDNVACVFKNNISYGNDGLQYSGMSNFNCVKNTWNGGVTVSSADFLSLDNTGVSGPRQSDGSLPYLTFLRLATGSDLINAGTNVGLPYNGSAPDLGPFESGTIVVTEPVYVSSVVNNSTPSQIEITFDQSLANIVPSASAFTVIVNSTARSINSVAVSGSKVILTLSGAITESDIVTVAYSKPSSNPLQTSAGGQVSGFGAKTVTNNISPPAPAYVSSVVENASPSVIDIYFSLSLTNIVPSVSVFTVKVNSNTRSVTSIAVNGTRVSLTLSSPVVYGDIITFSYARPSTNSLQTTTKMQVPALGTTNVTNKVNPSVPVYVSSVIQNSSPAKLDITFNQVLSNSVPSASAFTVNVNSAARSVNSVAISGSVVTLTLSSPVSYGNTVTLSYAKPSSSPLQNSAGGQVASFASQKVTNNVGPVIPVFTGASVENATPSKLVITYNMSMANITPAASAFSVTVNSVSRAVSSVAISGTSVTLTLTSAVANGNAVKVSYTKPSSNPLQTPAGGQAASFTGQTVTNNVQVNNAAPVVMVNYQSEAYSGFVEELNASGSYDTNNDKLTFSWVVPGNIPVSSTTGSSIEYLSPATDVAQTVNFVVKVSDGKTVQSKTIPVEILPYKPGLDVAEVVKVESSGYTGTNFPGNIIDGNIGTMWAAEGDNQWLLLTLKEPFSVQHVKLAFQAGQKKESYFDIFGSEDTITWEQVLSKSNSCAFSGDLQVFEFPATKASKEFRYIKLVGHSNSADSWNYISEFRIFGYRHKNPTTYEELPIKIFPNPARDFFNVRIEETTLAHDFLRIVSMTGRTLVQQKIDPGVSEFRVPINLLKGIYLIQIGTKALTLFSQKLVVNN